MTLVYLWSRYQKDCIAREVKPYACRKMQEQNTAKSVPYNQIVCKARNAGLHYAAQQLSHTCPLKYEPREVFLAGINQSTVDKSTEVWLGTIEAKLQYEHWYCGHYHTVKKIDKLQFMFEDFTLLE